MRAALSFALMLALLLGGCSKSGPPPLTLAEIPEALKKSFASARMQTKKNAEAVAKQITDKQYAIASIQLQGLLQTDGLNPEQRDTVSAALATVNLTLAEMSGTAETSQAAGDSPGPANTPTVQATPQEAAAAKAALEHHIRTK